MEGLLAIIAFAILAFLFYKSRQHTKSQHASCPNCGTICEARSSAGLRDGQGHYYYNYTCPKCGKKFMK